MDGGDYRVLPFGELMDWTAAATPAPGGGSIAALTIGLAASLVAMVARSSRDSWPEAPGISAQALELAERCPRLARDDALVWEAAFDRLQAAVDAPTAGDDRLSDLLSTSADLPLLIAETGADVTALAALAARLGDGALRADAVSAAMLAHAGTKVAVHLIGVNLGTRDGDERSRRAAAVEWRAGQSLNEALGATT